MQFSAEETASFPSHVLVFNPLEVDRKLFFFAHKAGRKHKHTVKKASLKQVVVRQEQHDSLLSTFTPCGLVYATRQQVTGVNY